MEERSLWKAQVPSNCTLLELLGTSASVLKRTWWQVRPDLVTVTALGKIEGHGALGVLPVRGSDRESESGGKGTADVHGGVEIGNRAKKRWTGRPLVDGLAVFNFDVIDVELCEKVKNVVAYAEGVFALKRIGTNTDPDHDRTANLLVPHRHR